MATLGTVGIVDKGTYNPSTTYKKGNFVLYNDSTWLALVDDLLGVAPADGANWKYLAKGASTLVDTEGLLGTPGASTSNQSLVDEIADRILTKLIPYTSLADNGTTTTSGQYPLDAHYGKTLTDYYTGLNSKIQNYLIVNVKDFGVIGDGTTDDTTSFQSAVDSLTNGGTLIVPSGTNCLLGTINITHPVSIVGGGGNEGAAFITANSPTVTVFNITTVGVNVENLHFKSLTQQTSGQYININSAGRGMISNCYFTKYYIGIRNNNSINQIINGCFFENGTNHLTAAEGGAVLMGDLGYVASPVIENTTITAANDIPDEAPSYAICFKYVDGGFLNNVSCIKQNIGFICSPGTDQFTHGIYVANCLFDSSRYGCHMYPTNNATVEIISFTNCWFSKNSDTGLRMLSGGTGKVAGINITASHAFSNISGIYIGNNCERISISTCTIAGNTDSGILAVGNSKNINISGNNIGAFGDISTNNNGVSLIEACDKIIINGNIINGNTANQIYNTSTGATITVGTNITT